MEVNPVAVGAAARAWDEHHLELGAASRQVGDAAPGAFSAGVSATAARFASRWARTTLRLAEECEREADGLRTSVTEILAADDESGLSLLLLRAATQELR